MKYKLKTKDVIKKLEDNMKLHIANHKEACEAWKIKLISNLKSAINIIETNGEYSYYGLALSRPISHEKEYKEALTGLYMHEASEIDKMESFITVDQEDVNKFLLDKWKWKEDWNTLANSYTGKSY